MDQLILDYAKEGVFLALFLYLLVWTIPRMKLEFKQEMKEMEDRHIAAISRIEKKHEEEMEKMVKSSELRESELVRLLTMFEDKYDILTFKVEEIIKKLTS